MQHTTATVLFFAKTTFALVAQLALGHLCLDLRLPRGQRVALGSKTRHQMSPTMMRAVIFMAMCSGLCTAFSWPTMSSAQTIATKPTSPTGLMPEGLSTVGKVIQGISAAHGVAGFLVPDQLASLYGVEEVRSSSDHERVRILHERAA
jgi:hypothetical protein